MDIAFIGCDPGRSGAVAMIVGSTLDTVFSWSDDLHENHFNMMSIAKQIHIRGLQYSVVVERVHSLPQQGVKSTFTFGQANGELLQCIACAGLGFELVTPAKWQVDLNLKKDKTTSGPQHKKNLAKAARQLYPQPHFNVPQADAVLLAHWIKEKYLKGGD